MGRGGARPGAGRPKSALTKRTQEITTRVLAAGRTPLEVMLSVMDHFFAAGEYEKAVEVASRAAPFIHPKLAPIDSRGRDVKPNAEITINANMSPQQMADAYVRLVRNPSQVCSV
jgi:hypothetical protein